MINGLLIYNRNDYEKNIWFANRILEVATLYDMDIKLALTDEMVLGLEGNYFFVKLNGEELNGLNFVINRSRDSIIGTHFEMMGIKVFNSSLVTEICNNKAKTHQIINKSGINSVRTLIFNKNNYSINNVDLKFPFILKSSNGHGGEEVHKINSIDELDKSLAKIESFDFIIQEICLNPGKDIRVFVLGKEVVASVKRFSTDSFKSNFSLGGNSEKYYLTENEKIIVEKVINTLEFDFVGIDFILDEKENFLFNEVEDVVGTRTLYKNYDIDIVDMFLNYIKQNYKKR